MKAKVINANVVLYENKLWLEMELKDEKGWNFMQFFNSVSDVLNFFEVNTVKKLIGKETELIDRGKYLTPFGFKNKKQVLLNNVEERL